MFDVQTINADTIEPIPITQFNYALTLILKMNFDRNGESFHRKLFLLNFVWHVLMEMRLTFIYSFLRNSVLIRYRSNRDVDTMYTFVRKKSKNVCPDCSCAMPC